MREAITTISIVVPCFNEADNIETLHREVSQAMKEMQSAYALEFIFVDDGSTDSTRRVIADLVEHDKRVRGVVLSRNFGHESAIAAGLREAMGSAVVIMDADLQDSPDGVPKLVSRWEDGVDVVYAVRAHRKESAPLRAAFGGFYWVASRMMNINLPRDAGPFSLVSRRAVDALNSLDEAGRYFPGMRAFVGFSQEAVVVERGARVNGDTKYTLSRRTRLAVDALLAYSIAPLTAVVMLGLLSSVLAFLLGLAIVVFTLSGNYVVPGWASTITIVLLGSGVQLLTLGIIGQYVGRIYEEVKQRPDYIVAERLGEQKRDTLFMERADSASVN